MTQAEKITYMDIACRLADFPLSVIEIDLFVTLYELVIEHEGDLDMMRTLRAVTKVKDRAEINNMASLIKEGHKYLEDD